MPSRQLSETITVTRQRATLGSVMTNKTELINNLTVREHLANSDHNMIKPDTHFEIKKKS